MNIKQLYGVKKNDRYLALMILMAGILVYFIQEHVVFSADVASLLYDTELFLSGGTYVKDFFETNPPMIFILYTPIVYFQKVMMLNIREATSVYVILLSFVSLFFCYIFLKKIIADEDSRFRYMMMGALTFVFLMLPILDFGQREHFLVVLGMPYLFAVVMRAQHKPIQPAVAMLTGIMAGLVFSLKPFFLFPVILLEGYLIIATKNLWSSIRIEFLSATSIMVTYMAFIVMFHPMYFNVMLPLLSHWYFLGTKETWFAIFVRTKVIFCLMVVVYSVRCYKRVSFPELTQVFLLALMGCMLAFIVPRSAWGYHVLPAYGLSVILVVIYFYQVWLLELKKNVLNKLELTFVVAASFAVPLAIHISEIKLAVDIARSKIAAQLYGKIKAVGPKTMYCFSSYTTGLCFPFVSLNHIEFAGRFPSFWWLRGVIAMEASNNQHNMPSYLLKEKKYFIDLLADDLNHYQPQLVVVSKRDEKAFLPEGYSYSKYFSENAAFREAWSHYTWLTNVGSFTLYQRNPLI